MKKLVLTVWGGHLLLCALTWACFFFVDLFNSSWWLIFVVMPVIASFLYVVIGYLANHIVFRHLMDDVKHKKIKPAIIIWSVSLHPVIIFFGLVFLAVFFSLNLSVLVFSFHPYFFPVGLVMIALSHAYHLSGALIIYLLLTSILLAIVLPSLFMHIGFQFRNFRRRKLNALTNNANQEAREGAAAYIAGESGEIDHARKH